MRGLALLVCAVALLGIGGCGGDDDEGSGPSDELESALEEVEGAVRPDEAKKDAEPPDAEETVREYFALLNRREFSKAWELLDEPVREQFGGFDSWVAGYETTESSRIVSLKPTGGSGKSESFELEIQAVDSGPCEAALVRGFAGPWTLERRGERWLITAAQFSQVSGESAAACGGSAPVYFTDAAYQLSQEPSVIRIDNHDVLIGLSWSSWGSETAQGSGTLQHVICEPYCAAGPSIELAAGVTMSGIVSCGGSQQYATMTISAPGSPDGLTDQFAVANYGAC